MPAGRGAGGAHARGPLITAEYPGFAKYLPWGPFYGIFVKEGTDASVTETLSSAFQAVGTDAGYQELLANFNINLISISWVTPEARPPITSPPGGRIPSTP